MTEHEPRPLVQGQPETTAAKNPLEIALERIDQLLAKSEPASPEQIQAMAPEKKERYAAIDTVQALMGNIQLYIESLPEKARHYESSLKEIMAIAERASEKELTETILPRAKALLTKFRNDLAEKLKT